MKYYLILSDDLVESMSTLFDNKFLLVETSFDNVYTRQGFKIFEKLLDSENLVNEMKIYDEEGDELEIGEFLDVLEDYDMKVQ